MIISKRAHLNKQEQSQPLLAFIDEACSLSEIDLTNILNVNLKWERPRGDLITWVKLLNHFDEIFEKKISSYGLDATNPKLILMSTEDANLLVACLAFTNMLLEHCINRNIYGSSERIYQLIMSPTIDVRLAALEVAVRLGERYVNSSHLKKYGAPKETRQTVLELAKSFPPPVPIGFIQKQFNKSNNSDDMKPRSEHYSLMDTIDPKRVYPSKWSSLYFQYYSTSPTSSPPNSKQDEKSDKKQNRKVIQGEKGGLVAFTLCENTVKKSSLAHIFEKASESLPEEVWFQFTLAAFNAKAFSSRSVECMRLREKLLRLKCAAVAFTSLMCNAEFTSSNLFETEPYLINFLVDFVSPENSSIAGNDVNLSALKALESIAQKRQWGGELIRNLGANVTHGVLYQQLRLVNRQIREESDECFEKRNLLLFTLIGHFIENKSMIPRLASGGILQELLTFLDIKTKFRWTCSAAVNTIASLLRSSTEYISDFIRLDGFRLLIATIDYEVEFAIQNPDFAGGAPKDALVHYQISLRQVNYLRNLLRLCSQLLQADGSDRMRNLFDTSILATLKKVIQHSDLFGPPVVGACLDVVLYIIHNEPTAFAILKEAGVIDSILDSYAKLFMPSVEIQISLLEVLGAISLNKEGLQRVKETGALKIYFQSFYDLSIAKELVQGDISTSIGVSMDELGRHFPDLKPVILAEIKLLVKGMASYANQHLKPIRFYPAAGSGAFYRDGEAKVKEDPDSGEEIESWESTEGSTLVDNLFGFLIGLLQESGQWVKDITEDIPFSDWVSYIALTRAPIDYITSNGMTNLMNLLKFLEDEKPDYGLPLLLKALPKYLGSDLVQEFINSNSSEPFLQHSSNNQEQASQLLVDLNAINNILLILCESYLLPSNMVNEKYQSLINTLQEISFPIIDNLNKLMGRSIIEEAAIRLPLSPEIIEFTAPVLDAPDETPPVQIFGRKPKSESLNVTWADPRFKNTLQLRFLAYRFQHNIALILSDIAKSCMQKRQDFFSYEWRRAAVIQTKNLATQMEKLFERESLLLSNVASNYRLIATNLIAFICRSKDKGREVLSTALVSCFFHQTNLMSKINKRAIAAFSELLELSSDEGQRIQKLDYINNDESCIKSNFIIETLTLLSKASDLKFLPKLPFTHLFFNKKYCPNENAISEGIVTETALESMKFVSSAIGTNSLFCREKSCGAYERVPLSILFHIIDLMNQIWPAKPIHEYFVLDENRGTPSFDQIQYLMQELSLPQDQAVKLLKLAKTPESLEEDGNDKDLDLTPGDRQKLSNVNLEKFLEYKPIDSTSAREFDEMRATEHGFIIGRPLIELTAHIDHLDEQVAHFILERWLSLTEVIVDYIESLQNDTSEKANKCKSNALNLLRRLFTKDLFFDESKSWKDRKRDFTRFLGQFISDCGSDPSSVDKNYLRSALLFLEPLLSKTPPNTLPGLFPFFDDLDSNLKSQLLDILLRSKPSGSIDCCLAVCKMMYLFASIEEYKSLVASSEALKDIFWEIRDNSQQFTEQLKELQNTAISLVRVCFEDMALLENVFSAEIVKAFKRQPSGIKDFKRLLDENVELLSRDPTTFIDVASKLVRIENYDGKSHHGENLFLIDYGASHLEQGDVEMKDCDNTGGRGSQGLMHFLLLELMACSKKDWTSSPVEPENSPQAKEPRLNLLMRNSNFAYLCFLLQTTTELLGSYKHAKLEFITFSKKQCSEDRNRPRSTSLNFFIHQLNSSKSLANGSGDDAQRREAISSLSKLCLLALVSTPTMKDDETPDAKSEDVDLAIVRRFVMDIISRVIKDSLALRTSVASSYQKLFDVLDLCSCLLSSKFREMCFPLLSKSATKLDQFFIASAFIERQLPNQVMNAIADIDLNYPDITKLIKVGLKPLSHLARIKLTFGEYFESNHQEKDEDDVMSDDIGDETPDLFRNSTLGMYDADSESDDEFYDEGDPIEVVMSGSDLSQDDDDEDEDEDEDDEEGDFSDMDDDNMEEDEGDEGIEPGEFEGYDSGASEGDIEIIDELDIGSQSDESGEEGSDASEFFGFEGDEFEDGILADEEEEEDDDEFQYDEDELNGWLETFGNQEDSEDESSNPPRFGNIYSIEDQDEDSVIDIRSGEEDNNDSESTFESEIDEFGARVPNSAAREFVTSIFQVLRPALRQQNVSNIFEGLVNGRLRSYHLSGNRGDDSMLPGFDRAIEFMFNNKSQSSQKAALNHFYIRSIVERWRDAHAMFYVNGEQRLVEMVRTLISKNIQEESLEIHNKLNEEREKIRSQREEKIKLRREEARKKREEEAREREAERESGPNEDREPVILRIGDRDVDISGTDIDPEFFEALPDDMREEVFTQHVRERRANANNTGAEVREIDPDFLEALPDQIREEILQQEAMARRFSSGRLGFLDVDDEDESELEENEEGEEERREPLMLGNGRTVYPPGRRPKADETVPKKRKTFSTPLIDKAGVASMTRLLFIPQTFHQRTHIYYSLSQLCNNKQTRAEVLSLLIAILNDGLHSQKSLERMFFSVCSRASNSKILDESTKRTLPVNASPVVIGIQLIEAIFFLLDKNIHSRYYLLTEHENVFVTKRSQKKKIISGSAEDKYPINYLLKLLENPLLNEQHMFIDLLASVLQVGTRPLLLLKDKEKQHPPISTSSIPSDNLKLVVRILCSNECANTTFRRTISAMQNLSVMKNAQDVFSSELSDTATKLSHTVVTDLESLFHEIDGDNPKSSDSKILSKFTAASSDQAKLLRILTALDYMYENRPSTKEGDDGEQEKASQLTGLYERLELGKLWSALSACLRALEKDTESLSIATALLPLIEALMVVCKHSRVRDLQIKDVMKYEAKQIDFTKEPIESLFFSFTDEHKKLLNQMVRTNPNLMSGPFSMLVRNPRVLEFDNKKNYFDRQLHEKSTEAQKLSISIRRDQVFLDSYRALFFKSVDEFRKARLEINFKGESGIDAGGVTREWYQVLSRQMFNPDYALFSAIASDETTFHPNRTSFVNPEHLSFFKFIGRMIGKAIFDGCFLDCHFSRAVYKKVLDRPLSLKDMETLDLEYFKSLMWMLDNDITDIITEDFSVESDDYGEHKIIDLVPNGRNIPVTEENKHEYVRLVVEYRLQKSVEEQMNNFCVGFHEIIPKELVAIFDEQELELLISGLPDIDVADWQVNTTYNNYSPSSEQIQWFWRAVKSFDNEERAKLLQFATGTSKVPLNGFKELRGASGTCSFSIHRDYGSTDRLPSSHTCFNQIDLPAYESYETLRGSLLLAITEGHEGFGLA